MKIYIYVDRKLFARTLRTPIRSCFSITVRKNHCGSVRLRGIQYRVSMVLAYVHLDRKCTGEVIPFGSHFYSYPIHGVTPRDLM